MQEMIRSAGSEAESLVNMYDDVGRNAASALFWNTDTNDAASVRILTDLATAMGDLAQLGLILAEKYFSTKKHMSNSQARPENHKLNPLDMIWIEIPQLLKVEFF